MTDIPIPVEEPEPFPCRHIKGEGCESCDDRGTEACPNNNDEEEI